MKIQISENCTQTLLDNGFWLHEEKQQDGKIFSFTFVKYWHSYEIRHEMRDFASNSPVSYIKLGQKLNELGLCLKHDANSWNLKQILIAISENIPMNCKAWRLGISSDNRTVKGIYGSRKGYKEYLFKTFLENK
tara:strand:+ start:183 stop:584 length:402 start_codon:yes stop_codon:yes gene_type:complete